MRRLIAILPGAALVPAALLCLALFGCRATREPAAKPAPAPPAQPAQAAPANPAPATPAKPQ